MPIMIKNFNLWREELLFTGNIIQDKDNSIMPEESERQCNRYTELVDMVEGSEGYEVFQSLVDSLQSKHNYSVYESTFRVLDSFPNPQYAEYLVKSLPSLIRRDPSAESLAYVGCILAPIDSDTQRVEEFNLYLAQIPHKEKEVFLTAIAKLIDLEWLNEDTKLGLR